ncbi:MAG: SRPBCC domain-containing protein [Burkholderiales bacterium]
MNHGRKLAAALAALALVNAAAAATEADVRDTSYTAPDGTRVLELSVDIPAPVGDVWKAFATSDGFASWAAPVASVDMRDGGMIESSYDRKAQIGAPGNIRNAIVLVVPERLIVMRNVQAPPKTSFDVPTFQKLNTVIGFAPLGPKATRVTLQNPGYGSGPLYDGVYAAFKGGNTWTFMKLKERFETGPVDWNAPPPATPAK